MDSFEIRADSRFGLLSSSENAKRFLFLCLCSLLSLVLIPEQVKVVQKICHVRIYSDLEVPAVALPKKDLGVCIEVD